MAETQKQVEDSKPKAKTSYKQIRKYVEKNYGFKVHTAYIAEVKRNLGLLMYDAPNAVEELKHPRSHPTKKMVFAIKETLPSLLSVIKKIFCLEFVMIFFRNSVSSIDVSVNFPSKLKPLQERKQILTLYVFSKSRVLKKISRCIPGTQKSSR